MTSMVEILESEENLAAVSSVEYLIPLGQDEPHSSPVEKQGFFLRGKNELVKLDVPLENCFWQHSEGGNKFAVLDYVRNFLLVKREVFKNVKWEERLFVQGEHSAFMLDIKTSGFQIAITPESIHLHDESSPRSVEYRSNRSSKTGEKMKYDFYREKYAVLGLRTVPFKLKSRKQSWLIEFSQQLSRIKRLFA